MDKSLLTPLETSILVDFIIEMADHGFPLTLENIESYAMEIMRAHGESVRRLGKCWIHCFLTRHGDCISMKWGVTLDTIHANAVNPKTVSAFFDILERDIEEYSIDPSLIYNMDESAVPIGDGAVGHVAVRKGTKTQHVVCGGVQENITVIETICTDGTELRPAIIFKGKKLEPGSVQNNAIDAWYVLQTMI